MKTEIIEKENSRCVLKVEVAAAEIKAEFEKAYSELSKEAAIPGFRRGKAPLAMVKTRYRDAAKEEVMRNLVTSSLREALQKEKLEIVTEPLIRDIDFKTEEALSYKLEVEVRPEVSLGNYLNLKLTKRVKVITDKEIEENLALLQEKLARYLIVDGRELVPDDYAMVDMKVKEDGKEVFKREGVFIRIADEQFGQGFAEKVTGLKKGEGREFDLKTIHYEIRLREIKEKKLPAIDDGLAKDSGFDNLEALNLDIQKRLERQEEERTANDLKAQIGDYLLKEGTLSPPQSRIKMREEYWLKEIERQMEWQGKKEEFKTKEEEWKKKAHELSLKEVKLAYLLDEVGRREHLEAAEADMEKSLKKTYGHSEEHWEKARERLKKEELWDGFVSMVREDKTYQFIIQKAEISEEKWKEKEEE